VSLIPSTSCGTWSGLGRQEQHSTDRKGVHDLHRREVHDLHRTEVHDLDAMVAGAPMTRLLPHETRDRPESTTFAP